MEWAQDFLLVWSGFELLGALQAGRAGRLLYLGVLGAVGSVMPEAAAPVLLAMETLGSRRPS